LIPVTNSQFVAVVESITKLLGVLIWPAVILYILKRFSSPLSDFFSNLSEFSFKAPGMEATAKRKQVEAAAALGAAVAKRAVEVGQTENILEEAKAAAGAVADVVTPRNLERLGESTVLWVDDRPENNQYERQALEAFGVRFVLSTSTDDALAKTHNRTFDAIISDMGRPPDPRAGYTLLDALRNRGDQTPFVIYAGSRAPEHVAESQRHGAVGCTNRPQELIELVLSALGRSSKRSGKSA
jgi:CheY-like chemotaxis protein